MLSVLFRLWSVLLSLLTGAIIVAAWSYYRWELSDVFLLNISSHVNEGAISEHVHQFIRSITYAYIGLGCVTDVWWVIDLPNTLTSLSDKVGVRGSVVITIHKILCSFVGPVLLALSTSEPFYFGHWLIWTFVVPSAELMPSLDSSAAWLHWFITLLSALLLQLIRLAAYSGLVEQLNNMYYWSYTAVLGSGTQTPQTLMAVFFSLAFVTLLYIIYYLASVVVYVNGFDKGFLENPDPLTNKWDVAYWCSREKNLNVSLRLKFANVFSLLFGLIYILNFPGFDLFEISAAFLGEFEIVTPWLTKADRGVINNIIIFGAALRLGFVVHDNWLSSPLSCCILVVFLGLGVLPLPPKLAGMNAHFIM